MEQRDDEVDHAGGAMRQRNRRTPSSPLLPCAALVAVVVAFLVAGCAGAFPSPAPPAAQGANPPFDPRDAGVSAFLDRCRQRVDGWLRGSVVHPRTLRVEVDQVVDYRAGVDVGGTGAPLVEGLPAADPVARVPVRCGIGARLVGGNRSLEVRGGDQWRLLEFTEPGRLEGAWALRARKPGDYDLTLEMRPAVALLDGGSVVPAVPGGPAGMVLDSRVSATASWLQWFYLWWDANWSKLVAVVTAAGAAAAGLRGRVGRWRTRASASAGKSGPGSSGVDHVLGSTVRGGGTSRGRCGLRDPARPRPLPAPVAARPIPRHAPVRDRDGTEGPGAGTA